MAKDQEAALKAQFTPRVPQRATGLGGLPFFRAPSRNSKGFL